MTDAAVASTTEASGAWLRALDEVDGLIRDGVRVSIDAALTALFHKHVAGRAVALLASADFEEAAVELRVHDALADFRAQLRSTVDRLSEEGTPDDALTQVDPWATARRSITVETNLADLADLRGRKIAIAVLTEQPRVIESLDAVVSGFAGAIVTGRASTGRANVISLQAGRAADAAVQIIDRPLNEVRQRLTTDAHAFVDGLFTAR